MSTDLRRRVLDASLELVATVGVAGLSMREVARRAGVSHQAPYRHFADREAILAALVAEGFTDLAERMEGAVATATELDARLAASGEAYVTGALARPGHYRLLFRPDLVDPARYPEVAASGSRAFAVLRALAAQGTAEGRLQWLPGVETDAEREELFVTLAWSSVHGLASLLLDGPLPRADGLLDAARLAHLVPASLLARP